VQALQTLVRNLTVILLLAAFLEMLLPNKSMRGFVQMVMGLFVISAVLAPVAAFLHTPLAMDIPAWATTTLQDLPTIAGGGQGIKAGRDAVQEQYRQILIHQIQALVVVSHDEKPASVDIQFEESIEGVIEQPKIKEVIVDLDASKGDVKPVQPIIIGQPESVVLQQSSRAENVQKKIAEFLDLPKEKIIVRENH